MNDAEQDLRSKLGQGQFTAEYQPMVGLVTGRTVRFEALARWRRSDFVLVPPSRFIQLLEDTRTVQTLTTHILVSAFEMCSRVPDHVGFAVNVSPIELSDEGLPDRIEALAGERRVSLNRLTLEVTESPVLLDVPKAQATVKKLKRLGIKLALDDFGTGYSNLLYLQAFPFDELKIDQRFVRAMSYSPESLKIVLATLGMARSLGLVTVGEGVEQPQEADLLRDAGCDLLQGWLYGPSLPASQLARFVTEGHTSTTTQTCSRVTYSQEAPGLVSSRPAYAATTRCRLATVARRTAFRQAYSPAS